MNDGDNKSERDGETLVIAAPLWFKILCAAGYTALSLWGVLNWESVVGDLDVSRYPFRWMAVVGFIFGGAYWVARVMFTRSLLTPEGLLHRDILLRVTRESYSEIIKAEINRYNALLLYFKDGKCIQVETGASNLVQTVQFVKRQTGINPFHINQSADETD